MVNRDRLEFFNQRTNLAEVVPLSAPYVVFIDPCGACNISCAFCPCNNSEFEKEERHKIMSLEMFDKITDELLGFEERVKVINMFGFGEPLLNKNLVEMVKMAKQKKVCREIRITTNGLLLNEEISKGLVDAGLDMLRFSIEAVREEDYRNICHTEMNYENLVKQIKYLFEISRGTKTKVSVKILNVALRNDDDANKFYDIFEPIADYTYIQDTTQAWSEFEAYVPEGNYEAGNIGNMMDKDKICSFPLTTMTIHSNGDVCVCPQDWKFATKYGHVGEKPLVDMWKSQKLKSIQIAHLSGKRRVIPFCKTCNVCVSNDDVRKIAGTIIERINMFS